MYAPAHTFILFAHRRLSGTFAKRKIYGTQTKLTKTKGREDFYKANEG